MHDLAGIISILDDECLRPGEPTDGSFLEKLAQRLDGHRHFYSHRRANIKTQKIMGRDEFCLVHYAGEVTYNVRTFIEKNNDLLFRDLQAVMASSGSSVVEHCFRSLNKADKKRPETAITQFKNSLNDLIKILSSKEPSYIRCIKPNDFKQPMQFDDKLVSHQVKYLGLMENLRVRRAGFAYRRTYEAFLERYKCLSPDTWPNYRGPARNGVQVLVDALNYEKEEYRMGNTKIFIRFPKTLFDTEDAFQLKKHAIATIIQSRWRGYHQRKLYLRMRHAAVVIQKWVRRFLAQRERARRRRAADVIRAFIKGFITRNGPETPENRRFLAIAKVHWLKRLSNQLPSKVLDLSWPTCPSTCQEASRELHRLHRAHLARKYRLALTPEDKKQFELKVLAETLFKGKKNSYPSSIRERFVTDRLPAEQRVLRDSFMASPAWPTGEQLMYSCEAVKYDRRGYKPRQRALLASDRALYVLDAASRRTFKLKHRLPLDKLKVVITNESDGLVLVKIPQELKKDKVNAQCAAGARGRAPVTCGGVSKSSQRRVTNCQILRRTKL
ncbi:Myosin-IB [Eumeta japonica]|uniref:Myosin-IB n=1 Tax=Eumeta variegata TaxID=151549 RepID=A0A4C1U3T6_EUMVA|nr:Myosin-IB [Eumeta japonica]